MRGFEPPTHMPLNFSTALPTELHIHIKTIPTILEVGYNLRIQVCSNPLTILVRVLLGSHILLNYTSQIFIILSNQDSINQFVYPFRYATFINIVNILENGLLSKNVDTEIRTQINRIVFNNRPTFTKNPCLFILLILSRGAGVPFPVMSTFYIFFKEHFFLWSTWESNPLAGEHPSTDPFAYSSTAANCSTPYFGSPCK